jgi:hypothetical protein
MERGWRLFIGKLALKQMSGHYVQGERRRQEKTRTGQGLVYAGLPANVRT